MLLVFNPASIVHTLLEYGWGMVEVLVLAPIVVCIRPTPAVAKAMEHRVAMDLVLDLDMWYAVPIQTTVKLVIVVTGIDR